MAEINPHYQKLKMSYLFQEIEKRSESARLKNPDLLNFGIGDVTLPLAKPIVKAMCAAISELGETNTHRGYGPGGGYSFLREKIAQHDFSDQISPDEIFISNSAKSDSANIQELFHPNNIVALADPTYPVYIDSTVLAGRSKEVSENGTYEGVTYLPCTEENNFTPPLPSGAVDVIYLCSPNNPTGVALTKNALEKWVDYALKNKAIILFDAAYEAFITSNAPHSIYEIENANKVAIEFRSFSKKAGFTSLGCAYTVVPKDLHIPLHSLWKRRVSTKFNGVPYPIQRGAEATYSESGKEVLKCQIVQYQKQTKQLRDGLQKLGYTLFGGIDAPYIWCKAPSKMKSWEFFDYLLEHAGIICTPGSGFGPSGEGFVRFSAFASENTITQALKRLEALCALH